VCPRRVRGFALTEIAEAYFHLQPFEVSEERLQRYGQELSEIAARAASELFDPNCFIEIRLQSGSLLGWATVTTIASFIAGNVLNYKNLKGNLTEMAADAKKFAGWVTTLFVHKSSVPRDRIYRTESRTKTPGKLLRVMKRQDRLFSRRSKLSEPEVEREEKEINRLALEVLAELPVEDRSEVWSMLVDWGKRPRDEVSGTAGSRNRPRRKRHDSDLFEPDLFGDDMILPPAQLLPEHPKPPLAVEPGREFYFRFRLRDWQLLQSRSDSAQHLDAKLEEPE